MSQEVKVWEYSAESVRLCKELAAFQTKRQVAEVEYAVTLARDCEEYLQVAFGINSNTPLDISSSSLPHPIARENSHKTVHDRY